MNEETIDTQEETTEVEKPFGKKRFRRLTKPINVSVTLEEETVHGLEKLAFLDTRNVRDFIRMLCVKTVQKAIKDGTITPGPLDGVARETELEEGAVGD